MKMIHDLEIAIQDWKSGVGFSNTLQQLIQSKSSRYHHTTVRGKVFETKNPQKYFSNNSIDSKDTRTQLLQQRA
jgi:hypothetical protein